MDRVSLESPKSIHVKLVVDVVNSFLPPTLQYKVPSMSRAKQSRNHEDYYYFHALEPTPGSVSNPTTLLILRTRQIFVDQKKINILVGKTPKPPRLQYREVGNGERVDEIIRINHHTANKSSSIVSMLTVTALSPTETKFGELGLSMWRSTYVKFTVHQLDGLAQLEQDLKRDDLEVVGKIHQSLIVKCPDITCAVKMVANNNEFVRKYPFLSGVVHVKDDCFGKWWLENEGLPLMHHHGRLWVRNLIEPSSQEWIFSPHDPSIGDLQRNYVKSQGFVLSGKTMVAKWKATCEEVLEELTACENSTKFQDTKLTTETESLKVIQGNLKLIQAKEASAHEQFKRVDRILQLVTVSLDEHLNMTLTPDAHELIRNRATLSTQYLEAQSQKSQSEARLEETRSELATIIKLEADQRELVKYLADDVTDLIFRKRSLTTQNIYAQHRLKVAESFLQQAEDANRDLFANEVCTIGSFKHPIETAKNNLKGYTTFASILESIARPITGDSRTTASPRVDVCYLPSLYQILDQSIGPSGAVSYTNAIEIYRVLLAEFISRAHDDFAKHVIDSDEFQKSVSSMIEYVWVGVSCVYVLEAIEKILQSNDLNGAVNTFKLIDWESSFIKDKDLFKNAKELGTSLIPFGKAQVTRIRDLLLRLMNDYTLAETARTDKNVEFAEVKGNISNAKKELMRLHDEKRKMSTLNFEKDEDKKRQSLALQRVAANVTATNQRIAEMEAKIKMLKYRSVHEVKLHKPNCFGHLSDIRILCGLKDNQFPRFFSVGPTCRAVGLGLAPNPAYGPSAITVYLSVGGTNLMGGGSKDLFVMFPCPEGLLIMHLASNTFFSFSPILGGVFVPRQRCDASVWRTTGDRIDSLESGFLLVHTDKTWIQVNVQVEKTRLSAFPVPVVLTPAPPARSNLLKLALMNAVASLNTAFRFPLVEFKEAPTGPNSIQVQDPDPGGNCAEEGLRVCFLSSICDARVGGGQTIQEMLCALAAVKNGEQCSSAIVPFIRDDPSLDLSQVTGQMPFESSVFPIYVDGNLHQDWFPKTVILPVNPSRGSGLRIHNQPSSVSAVHASITFTCRSLLSNFMASDCVRVRRVEKLMATDMFTSPFLEHARQIVDLCIPITNHDTLTELLMSAMEKCSSSNWYQPYKLIKKSFDHCSPAERVGLNVLLAIVASLGNMRLTNGLSGHISQICQVISGSLTANDGNQIRKEDFDAHKKNLDFLEYQLGAVIDDMVSTFILTKKSAEFLKKCFKFSSWIGSYHESIEVSWQNIVDEVGKEIKACERTTTVKWGTYHRNDGKPNSLCYTPPGNAYINKFPDTIKQKLSAHVFVHDVGDAFQRLVSMVTLQTPCYPHTILCGESRSGKSTFARLLVDIADEHFGLKNRNMPTQTIRGIIVPNDPRQDNPTEGKILTREPTPRLFKFLWADLGGTKFTIGDYIEFNPKLSLARIYLQQASSIALEEFDGMLDAGKRNLTTKDGTAYHVSQQDAGGMNPGQGAKFNVRSALGQNQPACAVNVIPDVSGSAELLALDAQIQKISNTVLHNVSTLKNGVDIAKNPLTHMRAAVQGMSAMGAGQGSLVQSVDTGINLMDKLNGNAKSCESDLRSVHTDLRAVHGQLSTQVQRLQKELNDQVQSLQNLKAQSQKKTTAPVTHFYNVDVSQLRDMRNLEDKKWTPFADRVRNASQDPVFMLIRDVTKLQDKDALLVHDLVDLMPNRGFTLFVTGAEEELSKLWITFPRFKAAFAERIKFPNINPNEIESSLLLEIHRRGGPDFCIPQKLLTYWSKKVSLEDEKLTIGKCIQMVQDMFVEITAGRRTLVRDKTIGYEALFGANPVLKARDNFEPIVTLQNMTGLTKVKSALMETFRSVGRNLVLGLKGEEENPIYLHRSFLGNPGVGKTQIASIYARVLSALGVMKACKGSKEFLETTPMKLKGSVVGESEQNLKAAFATAQNDGQVLFIDEAYNFIQETVSTGRDPFLSACLETMLELLPGDGKALCAFRPVVLFAGYQEPMENLFNNSNPGLKSRLGQNPLIFEDYTDAELHTICRNMLKSRTIDSDVVDLIVDAVCRTRITKNFGNARVVAQYVNMCCKSLDPRAPLTADIVKKCLPQCDQLDYAEISKRPRLLKLFKDIQYIVTTARKAGKTPEIPMAYMITGPPGCGKTTMARHIGMILQYFEIFPPTRMEDSVRETSKEDFVSPYKDGGGAKIEALYEESLGKVLFLDEAYRLRDSKDAFSKLVDLITKPKYKGKVALCLAGYRDQMMKLLELNPGGARRFIQLEVETPSIDTLVEKFVTCLNDKHRTGEIVRANVEIVQNNRRALYDIIKKTKQRQGEHFGNFGFVEKLVESCRTHFKERRWNTDEIGLLADADEVPASALGDEPEESSALQVEAVALIQKYATEAAVQAKAEKQPEEEDVGVEMEAVEGGVSMNAIQLFQALLHRRFGQDFEAFNKELNVKNGAFLDEQETRDALNELGIDPNELDAMIKRLKLVLSQMKKEIADYMPTYRKMLDNHKAAQLNNDALQSLADKMKNLSGKALHEAQAEQARLKRIQEELQRQRDREDRCPSGMHGIGDPCQYCGGNPWPGAARYAGGR